MCRAIIRAKIVSHTMFRVDRSLFRTDVASSSDRTFHSLTEVPRIIKFLFFIFALCYFSVSLFLFIFLVSLSWQRHRLPRRSHFWRRTLDEDAILSVLASSRTPLHSNSASIRIVTLKSHYLHIDMYTYILASMRISYAQCASLTIIYCFVF